MATMIEKQINKAQKDVEKYTKAVNRYTALLEKKTAKCIKLNCNWTDDEWHQHREANDCTDDQYSAIFDRWINEDHLDEAKKNLAHAEKHLEKLTGKAEAKAEQQAEADRISGMENTWWKAMMKEELEKTPEQRKAEYEAWLKEFKAECLKDGIIIDKADGNWISGTTANKKHFMMYANSGYTERSLHCYTLRIESETIFTSGDFSTAYTYIKK